MTSPTPTRRATSTANSQEEKSRLPSGLDLKPFPMAEGVLVTLSVVAVGFVAFLVVYGLQCAGVLG